MRSDIKARLDATTSGNSNLTKVEQILERIDIAEDEILISANKIAQMLDGSSERADEIKNYESLKYDRERSMRILSVAYDYQQLEAEYKVLNTN